ncbi:hypothetical protein OIU74_009979 [Salix koriyanagi]|uniref:Uncharacterized protein n=1 Tax=Salix koriyanagi TaxID=2511006 RepID=A0A9Q0QL84_9ROSI|nr:hypothetical protein OIU74_009979 [Salix koriyanagi]
MFKSHKNRTILQSINFSTIA